MKLVAIFLLILTFPILIGCSQPAPLLSPNGTPAGLDAARELVFEYWSAFNSYEVERALSYYEEHYREQEREDVESKINRIKQFHVTLTVEEVSQPVLISEGKVEIRIELGTPIGPKYYKYHLIEVDGEWKICLKTPYEPTES